MANEASCICNYNIQGSGQLSTPGLQAILSFGARFSIVLYIYFSFSFS